MPNAAVWEQYRARRRARQRALEATYWQVVADLGYDPQIGLSDADMPAQALTPGPTRKRAPRRRPGPSETGRR